MSYSSTQVWPFSRLSPHKPAQVCTDANLKVLARVTVWTKPFSLVFFSCLFSSFVFFSF
ncbi:hypothetical protein NC652_036787 [Populus alba x Populus x berolinensis]|uniref:Uncharacterized protein n=1 Tax=Populus alba x Populus x berolinensis TaxID=444605 RepID=A0AAD6PV63_9ROSI|nr:hypothetical protein NC651_035637 [Populus alba x Populus x berolinensis]KAJ6871230.1 hypothetical protein NC652_036787 [Populus alba x Populus x berolinensis]KAJ6968736.1 hypothetical protein NC653_036644 [Populus alba x Populus x berolinensis]